MTDERLNEIEARLNAATKAPLRLGVSDPERDPVEVFRENLSHGDGDVWAVIAPEHPDTVGGWDDRPEHAAVVAVTGNGPTSKANAELIVNAPVDLADLLAEVRRYRALFNSLPARWA